MRSKLITSLTAILTVLTLLTAVLASSGLPSASAAPVERIILPDTRSAAPPSRPGVSRYANAWIHDDEKTWTLDTLVNIFHVSYPGNGGQPTVVSAYGDKVIAPGTTGDYDFYIENNGTVSMDYTLTAEGEATFTQGGQEYTIPIQAKLSRYDGKYLAGSEETWEPLEALDGVSDKGVVAGKHFMKYTLRWQWAFEQENVAEGDEYDTMLGNLAAEGGELRASIRLNVVAVEDPYPEYPGGLPKTGDQRPVELAVAVMAGSSLGLVFLLVVKRRNRGREK